MTDNTEKEVHPVSYRKCLQLIDASIAGLELTNQFVAIPQIVKIIQLQHELLSMLPEHFNNIILRELFDETVLKYETPEVLNFGGVNFRIVMEKLPTSESTSSLKKRWWTLNFKNKPNEKK